eukprot:scaffold1549_cov105-Cylindrotheca_fusiformis.AAC.10
MEPLSLDPWDRDFLDKFLSQPSPMTSLDSIDTTIWIMAADCSEDSEVLPDPPSGLFTTALYTSEETPLTWSALREANQEQEEFPPTCHFEANKTEDDGKQQETLNRGTDPAESDRPLDDTMSKVSANDDLEPLDMKRRVEEDYEKTAELAECLRKAGLIAAIKYSPRYGYQFVTDNDVLGGRGSGPSSHPGNKRYLKEYIGGKRDEFRNADGFQREQIIENVLELVLRQDGGEFLRYDKGDSIWRPVPDRGFKRVRRARVGIEFKMLYILLSLLTQIFYDWYTASVNIQGLIGEGRKGSEPE